MSLPISRRAYADMYGPTTGDRVRLGDTGLLIEVECDYCVYGEECKFGGGKVLRDGMGQAAGSSAFFTLANEKQAAGSSIKNPDRQGQD